MSTAYQLKLLDVLIWPHVTEKATLRLAERQYVFKVKKDSSKTDIKKAVQGIFNVVVEAVNVVNVRGKKKRFRQHEGTRQNWKKAYVTLKEGNTIEFS